MKIRRLIAAMAAGAMLIAAHGAAANEDISAAIDGLQNKYSDITTVSAHFTQSVSTKVGGDKQATDGRVWFKKPGMMRWSYSTKEELVSNGRLMWLFQPDLNQAIETKAQHSSIATDFLTGVGDLKKDFNITAAGKSRSTVTLALTPKTPMANIKKILLEVDSKEQLVVQTVVEDNFGSVTTVTFEKIELNRAISDSFFDYKPPKGAAIIRP